MKHLILALTLCVSVTAQAETKPVTDPVAKAEVNALIAELNSLMAQRGVIEAKKKLRPVIPPRNPAEPYYLEAAEIAEQVIKGYTQATLCCQARVCQGKLTGVSIGAACKVAEELDWELHDATIKHYRRELIDHADQK